MPSRKEMTQLRKLLVKHFTIEELRVLCFDLDVEYEELEGTTKTTKMQDLITYLERRNELGQLLAEVKEQRPNVNWPDVGEKAAPTGDSYIDEKTGLEMIRIPASEYLYGDDNRVDYLPEYWISKTPITNKHFVRFVRATDQKPPKYWQGPSPPANIADHPVILVSWHDATAYAKWAGMELPTEQEWEKAARGTDGRLYPWGNDWRENYCNTQEAGIKGATPVGQFSPQGDSPYGCVDMSGNVFEWTASWYDENKKVRVLRGGSWANGQNYARAAARNFPQPAYRDLDYRGGLGFRLVVRHPPH